MKNERKSKMPVPAGHSAKKKREQPAASTSKSNGKKPRASRISSFADSMDASSLPEQNPNPVLRVTPDGELIYANLAAVSLLGSSTGESVPAEWRDMARSTFEAGSNLDTNFRNGDRIYSALFVPVSKHGYVNVYCRDITVQKQTEAALLQSEENLRLAIQAARLCTWEMDLLHQTYKLGDNFEEVVGIAKEQLPADPRDATDKINVAEDLQAVREIVTECISSHKTDVPPLQYRLRHPETGQLIWVEVNSKLDYDADGRPVHMSGMLQNITARKYLEARMQAHEAELQAIIDQTPFMLTRCTRDLRYRFVSRAYAQMLGRKPEDVAGQPISEIMGEDGWNIIAAHVEKVLTGERVEYDAEIPFQDVGTRALHVIYTPDRDEQGDVTGWFASITDISTRKAAEQEIKRSLQREQWQREIAEQAWAVAEESRGRAEKELEERQQAEAALGKWADTPLLQEKRPAWLRYVMALAVTGLVIILRELLNPLLGNTLQYSMLLSAIAFSTWYGGVGPAILSLLLGYIGITALVLDPQQILAPTITTILSLGIFTASGGIVILLGESLRRAQKHAHQSAGVAVKREREAEFRLAEQKLAEQALRASEERFRDIFETAGVSVWLEDFSEVKKLIDDLREQGIRDLHAHVLKNPDLVRQAIRMVKVLDVNQETLDLYGASSKEQLLGSLSQMFSADSEQVFAAELVALAEGKETYRTESQTTTIDGRPISVLLTVHFNPQAGDYSRVTVTITDITERKQMEEKLAREREMFRRLFETMPVMSTIYDPETGSMLMNKHIQELTGWKQEEVTFESLLHALFPDPDYLQEVLGRMAAAAATKEWVDVRIQTRDGRTLNTVWSNISLMDGEKLVTGISLGIDMTERKRMEDALRLENERFMKFFDSNVVGIVIATADGRLQLANDYYLNLLGVTRQEFRDGWIDWKSFTAAEWLPADEKAIAQLTESGVSDAYEKEFVRRDGARVPVYIANTILPGPAGEIAAFVLDMSDRKRMENEIRESEARYRALVSQATAGIAESNLESALTFVNPRFCEMLGYLESELLGKTIWELTYTADLNQNKLLFQRMLHEGKAYQFEKRFIRKDGSHLWTNVSVSPILDSSGKPHGGVGVIIDIEERKRAEQSILNYARQQEALFNFAERLQHSYALHEIYNATLDAIQDALQCDGASILLFDETDRMRFVAWRGLSDSYRQTADGHSPWAVVDGEPQPIFVSEIDAADFSHELKTAIKNEGIDSLAFIPLVLNGKLIGKFMLYFDTPHEFTEAELDLSQTIARQLAFDIARKRAEENLRLSEQKFSSMFHAAPYAILLYRAADKTFADVNNTFLDMIGYSRDELIGRTSLEVGIAVDPDRRAKAIQRIDQDGHLSEHELRLRRKSGEVFWVSSSVERVTIHGEEFILAVSVDISERKQAEEEVIRLNAELQSQLDEMKTLMEILPTGVWIGNSDCSVITGNPAAYEIMGLQPGINASVTNADPQTPAGLQMFINGAEVLPEQAPMQQVARTGKPLYNIEHEFRYANGMRRSVYASIVPLFDQQGEVRKVIGAYTDLSERRRWEEELRRSAEYDAYRVRLADALRPLSDPDLILAESLRILGEKLNVDGVLYAAIEAAGETMVVLRNHVNANIPQITRRRSLKHYGKAVDTLRRGDEVVIHDMLTAAELDEKDRSRFLDQGIYSAVWIPILNEDRWAAALEVHHGQLRIWSRHELALIVETAERTCAALERAHSQQALRASEELYRAIARSIPGGGVYVIDKDMRYIVAEGPVTEAFGLSRQALEGRLVTEVFPDERGARMVDRLKRTFAGETVDFETHAQDRVYWTQQAPLYDSIGQAIILTVDVTERKRAEEALRNSEERMRLAIESHRMVAWEWEVVTDIVTASANFQDVYGLDEVRNAADGFALILPEDLPAHQEKVNRVLATGGEYHSEFRITRPVDGQVLWMEERATAITDAQGKVTRLVGIVIDVTERRKADENLRLSEQRLRMATEAASMFAWDSEPPTNTLHWSENAADVIGCRPEDLPQTMDGGLFFVNPEDGSRVLGEFTAATQQKTATYTTEFRGLGEVPTARNYLMHARILYDATGNPVRVLGVTQDITQRKQAEAELRQAREIAEQTADQMAKLQQITSAMANPLTSAQLAELILEQGTRAAGAAAGILVEVMNDGQAVKTVTALGYPPAAGPTEATPLSRKTPLADAIQTKQAVWLGSHAEYAVSYPELAEMERSFGNEALAALPLIVGDRAVGGLAFSFAEKRDFLLEERGFLLALAQQCAQGLERVRATEALRESEQRFAGFMQHLPGLAWIKDAQGRYIFINDAAEKAFRVARAELYGRTDAEVFLPSVAERFRRNDQQALLEGRGIQVIEELQHEDGILHYSLVNKFPITGSDDQGALIGGMAIDITERKQAEERLALLAQISELARDLEDADELMSAVAKVVGRHLQVNRCLFNEIDLEKGVEVVQRDDPDGLKSVSGLHRVTAYSSIISADMIEGITVVNHDSKTDPRTAEDYARLYHSTGERSYVAVPLMREGRWEASLWISDDKPRNWSSEDVAMLQTIAERTWTACEKLRIHGQLRDSEERLRVTFNTTAVGFAVLSPDTQFVDVNQAFCEIVGYTRQELLTMNFDFLIHPDYVKSTRNHVHRILKGKVSTSVIEKLYIRKDGSQVWVQNNMSLVRDVDGYPLHLIVLSQDVTERKQIESLERSATDNLLAAVEANAKFRAFFDQGSYFAGVIALDGTLIEANRLSLEFCGYRREDVVGKKFWDCGWWNPSPELMKLVGLGIQTAQHGETFRQETTYYMADGSIRNVDLIIAPIKDENGRILFLAPTGTDITERKRAEEELRQLNLLLEERVEKRTLQLETSDQLRRREMMERRQAQDRFAKSFNVSPAAMTITRFEDGMYRNVNPKFAELLGYEMEDVIGHTSLDLKIYQAPEEREELLKNIRNNNGKWTYETQLSTKSGKHLDVNISVAEIELEGEPHILSMIVDITERNQMMAALRASEQQLRTLFDVLPVGIAYLSENRRVIEHNRTLERILDLSREELLSGTQKTRQYIRPDGSPMPASEFASVRALREGRTIHNVETGVIKDGGQVIWTSVSATPISMPEPGVVVITVDVTDRKHVDDELRRSHRRYQMLSRRLVEIQEEERRTISRELHDRVGQSLAALNLNLSFLNNNLSGKVTLQIKSRIKDAIQLTEETISTIRDVMADLRPPALDDYGVEAALNAYTDTFSRRFGIPVALVKPAIPLPRLNPSIELTLLRIAQEALTNVAKHAGATQATVTLVLQADLVYLSVEDNGEGIRSWQMANRPGSHGLKIMRERAETFGGTLQVQSFHKQGTRIEVKIPIRSSDQQPSIRAEAN